MNTLVKQGWSLFDSLYIAFRHVFNRAVTVQFPYERPDTPLLYRGALSLVRDESGKDVCIACDACAKICPSSCITLLSHRGEDKKRMLDSFDVDMTKCCFCGFCEEICPTEPKAIQLTTLYDYATANRKEIDVDRDELYRNFEEPRV